MLNPRFHGNKQSKDEIEQKVESSAERADDVADEDGQLGAGQSSDKKTDYEAIYRVRRKADDPTRQTVKGCEKERVEDR
jgi:hypothetical protein